MKKILLTGANGGLGKNALPKKMQAFIIKKILKQK